MSNKLYRIRTRLPGSFTGNDYSYFFVVAPDPTSAENQVKEYLRCKDIGFIGDREIESISLLAEGTEYPNCKTILLLER